MQTGGCPNPNLPLVPFVQGHCGCGNPAQLPSRLEPLARFNHEPAAPRADIEFVPPRLQHRPHKEVGQPVDLSETGPAVSLDMVQAGSFCAYPGVTLRPHHEGQNRPSLPAIGGVEHLDLSGPQDVETPPRADPDVCLVVFTEGSDPVMGQTVVSGPMLGSGRVTKEGPSLTVPASSIPERVSNSSVTNPRSHGQSPRSAIHWPS